jgi:hypothetical protein
MRNTKRALKMIDTAIFRGDTDRIFFNGSFTVAAPWESSANHIRETPKVKAGSVNSRFGVSSTPSEEMTKSYLHPPQAYTKILTRGIACDR